MKAVAVVVAAGVGSRLPGPRPKQFREICGRPLLAHTLARFEACAGVDSMVVVLPSEGFEDCLSLLSPWRSRKVSAVVPGGPERQDSVALGLGALSLDYDGVVLVHDGARPLVTEELIREAAREAELSGAALVAVPVQDTIKEADATGIVLRTVDRERLYRAQTPQAFRAAILREALARAREDGFRATDEATLVERIGVRVRLVPGSERNIKVTTEEDLAIAELYLRSERA